MAGLHIDVSSFFAVPKAQSQCPNQDQKNTAGDAVTSGYCDQHRTISHEQHRPVGL